MASRSETGPSLSVESGLPSLPSPSQQPVSLLLSTLPSTARNFGLLLVLGILLCWTFNSKKLRDVKRGELPPGPKGLPVLGNLIAFLRARHDPVAFARFSREVASYGEMATYQLGARRWVFLNSNRVVREIISKRASVTAERPEYPVSGGLVSGNKRTVLRKTAQWQDGRKIMHHLLNGTSLKSYGHIQEDESVKLLHRYLQDPEHWYRHHYDYSYAIIHRIVVGETPTPSDDELDEFRRVTVEFVSSINASAFDFLPDIGFLQFVCKFWQEMGRDHHNVLQRWWDRTQRDHERQKMPNSFVHDVLLKPNTKFATDSEEAMYLASSIVAAGSDNVRRAHNVLMMALLCHPEVLQKARDDIEAICGNAARLPMLSDMEALPYLSAIIKESLRWRPVVPLLPQHHSTAPLYFEGYTFPAGTDFVVNSGAVSDEVNEPQVFRPERWLGTELNITEDLWAFGGGRRVCVGYKIAHQELFLALARLICCFDINSSDVAVDSKALNHQATGEPFKICLRPRSQAHVALIQADRAASHSLIY